MNRFAMMFARAWLAAALTVATGASAYAQDAVPDEERTLEFALFAGGSRSDNIARAPSGEENGTLARAGVLLGLEQRSRRLETGVEANIAYEHYTDQTFDDDVVGGVDGRLVLAIVPERFRWLVQENFGQITTDPFSADRPDNREDINYFTTGPELTVRLGGAFSALMGATYSSTQYETSELDSSRYGATLALVRELSSASNLSLYATGERVEFDDLEDQDFDRNQAFVRYGARGARTELTIDLGYTAMEIDQSTQQESSDGLLARIALTRDVSASSVLTVRAGTQFSDAGEMFRNAQGLRGVELEGQSIASTSDPFESRFIAASWDFARNRTEFGLSAQYYDENFETLAAQDQDREVLAYEGYFARQLSRSLEVSFAAAIENEEFAIGFEDQETQYSAALAWFAGRTIQLRLQLDRFDRQSSATDSEYTENRVSFFVSWSPVGFE